MSLRWSTLELIEKELIRVAQVQSEALVQDLDDL